MACRSIERSRLRASNVFFMENQIENYMGIDMETRVT